MNEVAFNWDALGALFANLDNEKQAEFLTGFTKELISWDTHYAREIQMVEISNILSDDTKEILKKYVSTLWYEEL